MQSPGTSALQRDGFFGTSGAGVGVASAGGGTACASEGRGVPPPPPYSAGHYTLSEAELATFRTQLCEHHRRSKCADADACPHSHCLTWQRRNPYDIVYFPQLCPGIEFRRTNKKMSLVRHCNRGRHCSFAHSKEEELYHPLTYKTRLCSVFPRCDRHYCPFAHYAGEMRDPLNVPLIRTFWTSQDIPEQQFSRRQKQLSLPMELPQLGPMHKQLQWGLDGLQQSSSRGSTPPPFGPALTSAVSPSTRQSLAFLGSSVEEMLTPSNHMQSPAAAVAAAATLQLLQRVSYGMGSDEGLAQATDHRQAKGSAGESNTSNSEAAADSCRSSVLEANSHRSRLQRGRRLPKNKMTTHMQMGLSRLPQEDHRESDILSSSRILPLAMQLLGPQASGMSPHQIQVTLDLAVKLASKMQPPQQLQPIEQALQHLQPLAQQQETDEAVVAMLQAAGLGGGVSLDTTGENHDYEPVNQSAEDGRYTIATTAASAADDAALALSEQLQRMGFGNRAQQHQSYHSIATPRATQPLATAAEAQQPQHQQHQEGEVHHTMSHANWLEGATGFQVSAATGVSAPGSACRSQQDQFRRSEGNCSNNNAITSSMLNGLSELGKALMMLQKQQEHNMGGYTPSGSNTLQQDACGAVQSMSMDISGVSFASGLSAALNPAAVPFLSLVSCMDQASQQQEGTAPGFSERRRQVPQRRVLPTEFSLPPRADQGFPIQDDYSGGSRSLSSAISGFKQQLQQQRQQQQQQQPQGGNGTTDPSPQVTTCAQTPVTATTPSPVRCCSPCAAHLPANLSGHSQPMNMNARNLPVHVSGLFSAGDSRNSKFRLHRDGHSAPTRRAPDA